MDTPRTTAVDQRPLVDEPPSPGASDPVDLLERLSDILVEIALTDGD